MRRDRLVFYSGELRKGNVDHLGAAQNETEACRISLMHITIIKMGYQPRGARSPILGIRFSSSLFFSPNYFNLNLEFVCAFALLVRSYAFAFCLFSSNLSLLLKLFLLTSELFTKLFVVSFPEIATFDNLSISVLKSWATRLFSRTLSFNPSLDSFKRLIFLCNSVGRSLLIVVLP